jgi:hypothetical protein
MPNATWLISFGNLNQWLQIKIYWLASMEMANTKIFETCFILVMVMLWKNLI